METWNAQPLQQQIFDDSPFVRCAAAEDLAATNLAKAQFPASIDRLTLALRDADFRVREAAVDSLATFKADAHGALPELIELLADPDVEFRFKVAMAISTIGCSPELLCQPLRQALEHHDECTIAALAMVASLLDLRSAELHTIALNGFQSHHHSQGSLELAVTTCPEDLLPATAAALVTVALAERELVPAIRGLLRQRLPKLDREFPELTLAYLTFRAERHQHQLPTPLSSQGLLDFYPEHCMHVISEVGAEAFVDWASSNALGVSAIAAALGFFIKYNKDSSRNPEALKELGLLVEQETDDRCQVLEVLKGLGQRAQPLVRSIATALEDPDPYTRTIARQTLTVINSAYTPERLTD